MTDEPSPAISFRPVIIITLVLCLAVAMAPWLSGGQDPLAALLSGAALVLAALLIWRQPEARRLRFGPLTASYAVLMATAVLSCLWTANRYSSLVWITQWLMAGVAFWLAYTVVAEPKGRQWLLRAYLVSAGLFCGYAIWMYLTSEYGRLTGTFYWANPAAAYLMPAIIIATDRVRQARGRQWYGWAGLAALYLGAFVLADSRAASLVLALISLVYLVISRTSRRFWIHLLFILVATTVLCSGLIKLSTFTVHKSAEGLPGSRFAEALSGESRSGQDRLYYLRSAFDIWFAHPLSGTGAGTYGDVHPHYQYRVVSASANAHNVYVQTLAELGLVGAVALASVLLWLFTGTLRGLMAEPELVPVALGAAGLLIHFGLDIDASYPALLLLAAALLGMTYRQWRTGRGRAGWPAPVLALAGLILAGSFYQASGWVRRAEAATEDGDYAAAADNYAQARHGTLSNPDLLNAEGIDLYSLALQGGDGAGEAAQQALERARQAEHEDPYDGQHHQLEGRVLLLQGDIAGAQAAFREALRLDPFNHPDYAVDLALAQVKTGDSGGAVATAHAMLGHYPDDVVANRSTDRTVRPALADLEAVIGNDALQRGDTAAARRAAEAALSYDSGSLRGRALMHQVELKRTDH